MLKKVILPILLFLLSACQQLNVSSPSDEEYLRRLGHFDKADNFSKKDSFKVAMLLPLSGKASTFGNGLQNAAMMALDDTKNDLLEVRFYDTQSSPEGAIAAFNQALNENVKLILGPLMAAEVEAIGKPAKNKKIPVISFSTSPAVLGSGVYTLGLLSDEQVNRIISYAARLNRQKIAVLTANTDAGIHIAHSAIQAAAKNNMTVTKIGFYDPSTLEFSELIKQISDHQETNNKPVNDKNPAQNISEENTEDNSISEHTNFDTVLIAETGSRLKAIAGTFGYYDITFPDILFLGTSVWDNTNLTKETTLYGGLYPILSRNHSEYFNKKYKDLFGEIPNPLYVYAYDGVALSSALSKVENSDLYQAIENPEGFMGMNGTFRLFSSGKNEHNLNIVEVTATGLKRVNTAPVRFTDVMDEKPVFSYEMPEILGVQPETFFSDFPDVSSKEKSHFGLF